MKNVKRGEIYYADLSPVIGSEQGGMRPVLILQNDIGNRFSPTTIVIPLTSIQKKKTQQQEETKEEFQLSETWAQDAQDDLEEWIEEQGIQLRY